MKKQQRINWKQGMEITPEIFIESDEYHISERELLGTLLASRIYGIFPNSKFSMDAEIYNHQMVVKISDCIALLSNGSVMNIQNSSFKKELPVNEISECYVVLSAIGNNHDESELHIVPQYDISFAIAGEPVGNGIPVLKIFRSAPSWEIDTNYIPPSIALNAVPSLMNKYVEIMEIIHKILNYYTTKDSNYLLFTLLQIELNSFSFKETPESLTQIMKKFCLIFQAYLKTTQDIEPLESIKKFVRMTYNHHEIEKTLNMGHASLIEILNIFEAEPIPEIIEIKV